jgi:hypothetical protein
MMNGWRFYLKQGGGCLAQAKRGELNLPRDPYIRMKFTRDLSDARTEALLMAAEDHGPLMHAHIGMILALHGAKPIPEYDSSKERRWG